MLKIWDKDIIFCVTAHVQYVNLTGMVHAYTYNKFTKYITIGIAQVYFKVDLHNFLCFSFAIVYTVLDINFYDICDIFNIYRHGTIRFKHYPIILPSRALI